MIKAAINGGGVARMKSRRFRSHPRQWRLIQQKFIINTIFKANLFREIIQKITIIAGLIVELHSCYLFTVINIRVF